MPLRLCRRIETLTDSMYRCIQSAFSASSLNTVYWNVTIWHNLFSLPIYISISFSLHPFLILLQQIDKKKIIRFQRTKKSKINKNINSVKKYYLSYTWTVRGKLCSAILPTVKKPTDYIFLCINELHINRLKVSSEAEDKFRRKSLVSREAILSI